MPNKIKTYELRKLIKQDDGKLILFGQSNIVNNDILNIIRYNSNGSIDSTFGKNGIIYGTNFSMTKNCYCNAAISIENNGLMINVVSNGFNGILKLKNNGQKDSSFGIDGMCTTNINSLNDSWDMIQDNKGRFICVGGLYVNFKSKNFVMRFKKNGYLDSSFSMDGYDTFSIKQIRGEQAVSIAFQKNGSILVGSFIDDGNGSFAFGIVRYSADKTLDIHQIINEGLQLKIYPNPIINEFYIENSQSQDLSKISLDIYDQNGNILQSLFGDEELFLKNSTLKYVIPHKFSSGNYILKIKSRYQEQVFRLNYMK